MENKPSSVPIAFKWAIISLITSIVLTYGYQFLSIDTSSPLRYISFIPVIAFLLLTQKEYREKLNGFLTFGEGFLAGLFFAIFSSVLGAIFTFIYLKFLSPDVWQQTLVAMQAKLTAQGNISEDQIDTVINLYRNYGVLITTGVAMLVGPIVGAIISLIGAAILKKEPTVADIEQRSSIYNDPAV